MVAKFFGCHSTSKDILIEGTTVRLSRTFSAILSTVLIAGTLASQTASAQQYKKFTRLGTSQSVCSGGVQTEAQLQNFFANNPSAIRQLLNDSGWSGSADDLIAAVAAGNLNVRSYPVGTRLLFGSAKVNGQYVAKPYREWAGNKSFEAFQIDLKSGCKVYDIIIPKACCNVSLASVVNDTSPECIAPVAAIAPAAPVVVKEPAPVVRVVKKAALGLVPFLGAFAGTETRPRFETNWQMDKRDSSGIVGLRAGLLKEVSAKTAIFGQASYVDRQGINGGNVYPENNFAVDLGLQRKLSEKTFIGGGIGAWNVDDSDFRDASLFALVGGDLGKTKLEWFLEGRVFDSESDILDSISDNKMFSAGLRYMIK